MGWFLFAAAAASSMTAGEVFASYLDVVYKIVLVALGLGTVIFVHELGHFAVAKWCGVKCEKFYLGFDIWGKKFFSFQWGETEYGIGVLPLGGYVKMLGQDDNPNRQADEVKRSKVEGAPTTEVAVDSPAPQDPEPLDPRSYLAKTVPQRMAIISAGVIMNVIFAFFIFMAAYSMGVTYMPPVISAAVPGQPAWIAGIQSGDEIYEIGGKRALTFDDIFEEVMLSHPDAEGVSITVHRPDESAPDGYREVKFKILPDRKREKPMIGVAMAQSTYLNKFEPVADHSPAAASSLKFEGLDKVVAINDTPVTTYAELRMALARNAAKPINVKVERADGKNGAKKEVSIPVGVRPMKTLGIVVALGTVTAVQVGSPAEKAGIVKGDLLVNFADEAVGDPMTLPERVFRHAGQETAVTVQRGTSNHTLKVTPADLPPPPEGAMSTHAPLEIPALGMTCQIHSRITKILPDSPAAAAAGGKTLELPILSIELIPDEKGKETEDALSKRYGIQNQKMKLTPEEGQEEPKYAWPFVFKRIQNTAPGTQVKLTLEGDVEVTIKPGESTDFFLADRGLECDLFREKMKAKNLSEAFNMTTRKMTGTMRMIYRFLSRLTDPQIASNAGGPVQIAATAYGFVSMGFSDFLLFLGILSVNLAVINFLPIPVLDGGHMVFLAWEGIRGKPANEKWTFLLHMAGLALILCLVVLVFTLDGKFAIKKWQNW